MPQHYSNSSKQLYNFSTSTFDKVLQNTTSGSHQIIHQLPIQQGTTQAQSLNQQNIIVISSNTVGAVDRQSCLLPSSCIGSKSQSCSCCNLANAWKEMGFVIEAEQAYNTG
uniref:Uncharacterized protein n=1 Tax=Meloidogyne incognita TaxID=6306 RepID=A0A914KHV5_MELIC